MLPPVTPNGLIQDLQYRVEALEALLLHLMTPNWLQHPHCRACQHWLRLLRQVPSETTPSPELGGTRQVPRAIRFYGDDP